jgi:hypothetical protein
LQRKITIRVYKIETWMGKEEDYYNEATRIELFEDIPLDKIHEAMGLLGFANTPYKVQEGDGWGSNKVLFIDPKLIAIDNRLAEKRANNLKDMQAKADEFNKLPIVVQEWNFGEGYSLKMMRTEAKFNPSYSTNRIGGGVSVHLFKNDKDETQYWYISRYISQDGKVLKKAFNEGMKYTITSETVREAVIGKLKEIYEAEKTFSQKWSLGR